MLMTRRFVPFVLLLAVLSLSLHAQPNVERIGPAVGHMVPDFSGTDQFGRQQTLQSVLGPNGAMLVFFRSADW